MITDNTDNNEISKMLQFVPQVGDIFDVKDKVGEGKYFKKVFSFIVKKLFFNYKFVLVSSLCCHFSHHTELC